MTPPPAGTVAARRAAARTAPGRRRAPARRTSGPLKARAAAGVATRVAPRIPRRVSGPARARTAQPPLGVRLAAFASTLPDRSIVDRLVRGQGWIALVGTLLIGLVAMQVSLLKLNAGIGSSVERAAALDRSNGELRAQVSQLESGERIQEKAASLGMVMPPAGQISYLRAGGASARGAAAEALRQQSFNDPSKAQALPGEGDGQSDPWANATGTDSTSGDSTSGSTDSSSTDSTSSDSSSSDSSSTDSTSSDSSSSDSSSSDGSSTDSSSTDTSGDSTTASVGGTASG